MRTLMLTLISGLALLSIAKTIADSFVLYISPNRADYRLFVVNSTPDFDPDSPEEKKVLEELLHRKRVKVRMSPPLSPHGSPHPSSTGSAPR